MNQIDEQKKKNIEDCENIKNIETRLRMTRSENSSTSNCKNHGLKVNLHPDPSSSDSSDLSSSDLAPKRKKSKKKKKRRKHWKDGSSDSSSSDDSDSSEDSHYRRKRRQDKKHREKYPIRLCATLTSTFLMPSS